jgi:Protein of unknown function (DUF2948)
MPDLKLIALDNEDLQVLSANLQDAVLRIGDLSFSKREKRFAAVANRFDWHDAAGKPQGTDRRKNNAFKRRQCGLRFERVLGAKLAGIDLNDKSAVLSLLSISYTSSDDPHGIVILHFSGGGAIRLEVECIEAELRDLGAAWSTDNKPAHADEQSGDSG